MDGYCPESVCVQSVPCTKHGVSILCTVLLVYVCPMPKRGGTTGSATSQAKASPGLWVCDVDGGIYSSTGKPANASPWLFTVGCCVTIGQPVLASACGWCHRGSKMVQVASEPSSRPASQASLAVKQSSSRVIVIVSQTVKPACCRVYQHQPVLGGGGGGWA